MPAPEMFLALPMPREQLPNAKSVRTTLIASSVAAIRRRGLYERYLPNLDVKWREPVLQAVAGLWLPMEAGMAHYAACDALGLTAAEQQSIGHEVGDRVEGTLLQTMIRSAKTAGVTPWTALSFTKKLQDRLFEGGGCQVMKLGPKEARVDFVNNALARYGYFRNGMRGMFTAACQLFCEKVYVNEVPKTATDMACALRVSWA